MFHFISACLILKSTNLDKPWTCLVPSSKIYSNQVLCLTVGKLLSTVILKVVCHLIQRAIETRIRILIMVYWISYHRIRISLAHTPYYIYLSR